MSQMDVSSFRTVEVKCRSRIIVVTELKQDFWIEELNHQTLKHLENIQKSS